MKTIRNNQKLILVLAGLVIAILLLVKLIGWNKVYHVFSDDQSEKITVLRDRITRDSLTVLALQQQLFGLQDSSIKYKDLYNQAKSHYTVITKYYEKKLDQVKGLSNLEAIDYFLSMTECEDQRDTNVIVRLSNIVCANINFTNEEMYHAQRDTLQLMNETSTRRIVILEDMLTTQGQVVETQKGEIQNYQELTSTQGKVVQDLKEANKKTEKKVRRVKNIAIITGSAALVLGAVLILQ